MYGVLKTQQKYFKNNQIHNSASKVYLYENFIYIYIYKTKDIYATIIVCFN